MMRWRTTRPGAPGHRADVPRLAAGGRLPDAAEQPRPRGRRAPRRPRRLRRHRPRRPLVGRRSTRCCRTLRTLADDETMLVQSGKPVGVFRTHEWAPRVLIANSNLVPDWANWDEFRRLEAAGLTMYGQMTAGSWIYIGTQGILQGTYECFAEIARRRFGGSLAGTITLTAGLGGMGGAQPLAITMNDGVALCIDVDPPASSGASRRATSTRSPTTSTTRSPAAPRRATSGGRCRSASSATPPTSLPRLLDARLPGRHRHRPDERPRPAVVRARRRHAGGRGRDGPHRPGACSSAGPASRWRRTARRWSGSSTRGAEVFDYGNSLRAEAELGGFDRAFAYPGFLPGLHPPAVLRGQGPVPLGRPVRRPGRHRRHRPGRARGVPRRRGAGPLDPPRRRAGRVPGPAGADLLARLRRARTASGCASTRWSAAASVPAPIVIGRDHLDSGSVASPYRETEAMADGSDAIADWPLLNALVNTASGATWVSIHHGGGVGIGRSIHAGMVAVADGTDLAAAEAGAGADHRPGHGRDPPRRRRLRPRRRGRRRARRPHPDASG